MNEITFSYNANFFLFVTLENARAMAQGRLPPSQTSLPVLTGTPVAGMSYLDRPSPAGYFIFPDLSVRHEGKYRLSFTLYEQLKDNKDSDGDGFNSMEIPQINAHVSHRLEVKSTPFTVYSAKKFPGLAESTGLSQSVAEQGCRVRIRKDVRMRRRTEVKASKEWDNYEDETARERARRTATPDMYGQQGIPNMPKVDFEPRPRSVSIGSTAPADLQQRRGSVHEVSHGYQQDYVVTPRTPQHCFSQPSPYDNGMGHAYQYQSHQQQQNQPSMPSPCHYQHQQQQHNYFHQPQCHQHQQQQQQQPPQMMMQPPQAPYQAASQAYHPPPPVSAQRQYDSYSQSSQPPPMYEQVHHGHHGSVDSAASTYERRASMSHPPGMTQPIPYQSHGNAGASCADGSNHAHHMPVSMPAIAQPPILNCQPNTIKAESGSSTYNMLPATTSSEASSHIGDHRMLHASSFDDQHKVLGKRGRDSSFGSQQLQEQRLQNGDRPDPSRINHVVPYMGPYPEEEGSNSPPDVQPMSYRRADGTQCRRTVPQLH